MIDTHCHLTSHGLIEQVDDVIARAHDAGVDRMITVAIDPGTTRTALPLVANDPGTFTTVGIHPHEADHWQHAGSIQEAFAELAGGSRVIAFGEMGLDWHYDDPAPPVQRKCFQYQLEVIAQMTDDKAAAMPIVIHNRKATDETLAMIRDSGLPGERFVFHCFTGEADELQAILNLGAMVSFTGIVTFKNSRSLAEASDRVPLDRLMVETDSPYLTPEPHRKVRPNEPQYVVDVARFLAERRQMTFVNFVDAVDRNAERFFKLGSSD